MKLKNKIILVGHGGSGKDHLGKHLIEQGFKKNVAYTTRPKREGEENGKDYFFITSDEFIQKIDENYWHEYNCFIPEKNWYYGSSKPQYDKCTLFIKEPHGVSLLSDEEREECLVVYINIDEDIRRERMSIRKKNADSIERRIEGDRKDFVDFTNFDIEVNDPEFNVNEVYEIIIKKMYETSS